MTRTHAWFVSGLALLFVCGFLASCSKAPSDSGSDATASHEDLRTAAETARGAAEGVGAARYAPEPFKKGVTALRSADDEANAAEPSAGKVRSLYQQATRYFESAATDAGKNRQRVEKIEKQKLEFETLLAEKEKAEVPLATLDKAGLDEAKAKFKEAVELLEEVELLKAENKFKAALSDLKDSIARVDRQQSSQARATQQKERTALARQRALDAKGREIAPGDIGYAESQEVLGQQNLDNAEYDLATQYFQSAEAYYNTAFTTASASTAVASTDPGASESAGTTDLNGNPRETYRPAEGIEVVKPPTEGGAVIDGADWLLRTLHGSPEIANGMLRLTYGSGQGPDLKQDLFIKKGAQFLHFEGATGVGSDQYLMAGNTIGFVQLMPVFRDQVRVEIEFLSQLILPNDPTFQILLMSSGKDYYGSHFGTNILVQSGSAGGSKEIPSPIEKYRKPVKNWLTKTETHKMLFEYNKKSDEEKGTLRVTFDEDEVAQFSSDFLRSGRVGFAWNNTKWIVNELRVVGRLDQDWLKEAAAKGSAADEGTTSEDDDPFGF